MGRDVSQGISIYSHNPMGRESTPGKSYDRKDTKAESALNDTPRPSFIDFNNDPNASPSLVDFNTMQKYNRQENVQELNNQNSEIILTEEID